MPIAYLDIRIPAPRPASRVAILGIPAAHCLAGLAGRFPDLRVHGHRERAIPGAYRAIRLFRLMGGQGCFGRHRPVHHEQRADNPGRSRDHAQVLSSHLPLSFCANRTTPPGAFCLERRRIASQDLRIARARAASKPNDRSSRAQGGTGTSASFPLPLAAPVTLKLRMTVGAAA